jgi:hypothetical protein
VYPGPTQVDGHTRQVDRMKAASDPLSGLHHHTFDPGMGQGVRDRQTRDPRADNHHALDRTRDTGGISDRPSS